MTELQLKNILDSMWSFDDVCTFQDPTHILDNGSYVINETFVAYCIERGYYTEEK